MRNQYKTNDVSIVICCYNSSKRLPETLAHLKAQVVPDHIPWEVIVVDNASTDGTSQVARALWGELPGVPFRVVREAKQGLSNARNRGLMESKGDLICYIDDDVRPKENWLINIYNVALRSDADAIAGKVILPEHLCRSWMKPLHRTKLASTERINPENPTEMIGANMAFRRRVLTRVPQFDDELGAGKSGFGEESLFSMQLLEAGFNFVFAKDAIVEHHFDENRLLRKHWIDTEKKRAFGKAYISHHWEHKNFDNLFFKYLQRLYWLFLWRLSHTGLILQKEGCSIEEINLIKSISYHKKLIVESKKPYKYDFRGLKKKY